MRATGLMQARKGVASAVDTHGTTKMGRETRWGLLVFAEALV